LKLKKELNLLGVFCVASGAMISSGIFILPGLAFANAGPAVIISYLIAGLFSLAGMLSLAVERQLPSSSLEAEKE